VEDVLSELESLVQQYEKESKDPLAQKRFLNKMMLPLIASQERKNIAAHNNCFDSEENSLLFFVLQANSVSDFRLNTSPDPDPGF
jgi:hypothetical protein